MVFGLTIGTERATALQQSIQDELTKRGYSPDADPVMAEYITIMVINNKTSAQITSELEDLIGSDFNSSFTDWLFEEAAKGAAEPDATPQPPPAKPEQPIDPGPSKTIPAFVAGDSPRNGPGAPRNGIYQHAISQALPSSSNSAQKRTASARSPSPTHPNKARRTDLPTGPRAMYRDGPVPGGNTHSNPRSLLDRVGGPAGRGPKNFQRDEIQARIDNIVGNAPDNNMMMPPNFQGMGMDMNAAMAANMANPIMLQEMMMNQMALMAQMASSMGIINPATGQFGGQGFPMQGVMQNDMGMFPNNMNNGFPPHQGPGNNGPNGGNGRGRGGSQRGGRGAGRGRGFGPGGPAPPMAAAKSNETINDTPAGFTPAPIAAPIPVTATPLASTPSAASRAAAPQPAYALPERPQSPTLCKFALKCTNAHCRYSHPSPVATAESGVVLSNEACEKGKACKDKDCIKAHVSPAVLNPQGTQAPPNAAPAPAAQPHHAPVQCRFGAACTRPGCTFAHPPRQTHFATQCRFGAACTRAQCSFQHPEGRVLPSTFHRGLAPTGPIVSVPTPETGSMGSSQHRSVTFNNASTNAAAKERLEKQMKEIQQKKTEAEKAVRDAEAAANKKSDVGPVSVNA
ncbi:hypothetical protein HYPSUDRAFT_128369 [Hypholoma sublateritium FD-334 SS-4]|uniref:C3H1-type domain-containing protein n=1 Tax=Hypholoma sublateritium (strain FD-334 SS-4) TaxID=945553 RepID=A0A0D2LLP8_HYPSF|nr:hypothetical protein HYPSUDRAFT_128369 [Hypholoma sublateritium FD-334 SS-4]